MFQYLIFGHIFFFEVWIILHPSHDCIFVQLKWPSRIETNFITFFVVLEKVDFSIDWYTALLAKQWATEFQHNGGNTFIQMEIVRNNDFFVYYDEYCLAPQLTWIKHYSVQLVAYLKHPLKFCKISCVPLNNHCFLSQCNHENEIFIMNNLFVSTLNIVTCYIICLNNGRKYSDEERTAVWV
jgi:hypothetical protein